MRHIAVLHTFVPRPVRHAVFVALAVVAMTADGAARDVANGDGANGDRAAGGLAAARTDGRSGLDLRGNWSLTVENDIVAGTDREYTNGAHLSWLSARGDVPAWANSLIAAIPLLAGDGQRRWGLTFGQSIFTPENIAEPVLERNDRPYAGWLYAGIALHSESANRLDTIELDVGIVGPLSFAEQTQKTVHRWIDSTIPRGWDNQLDTEPGAALIFERQWRERLLTLSQREAGVAVDAVPLVGGALGNVYTYATAGLSLRFGNNLPSDFGPPRIRPGLSGSGFFDLERDYGWYLFASAEGRAVARNVFLDGNSFSDSHSVDKRTLVADFQLGVAVTFSFARLVVAQVFRSSEYEGDDAFDSFGTLTLSVKF